MFAIHRASPPKPPADLGPPAAPRRAATGRGAPRRTPPAPPTLASALSHLVVESLLRPAGALILGDPDVIAGLATVEAADEPVTVVSGDAGTAALVRHPAPGGNAFVWVTGGALGPVRQVATAFRLDGLDRHPSAVAWLDCPSGRLVVGTPEAVAAWGTDIEPEEGLSAQARAFRPARRYCGLVVVARVPRRPHRILALEGATGLHAVIVDVAAEEFALAG
jgi:hypothetical protein